MKKTLLIIMLLVLSNQALSDDIDLYVSNNSITVPRPNVLIILDNSPSMVWYDVDGNYLSNRNVNNPNTRAHKAREIIIDLINDNPGVDFALQLFNENRDSSSNQKDGGRIVFGFQDLSVPANKTALINILDTDDDNTNNNYTTFNGNGTPLCETLYETYRYLSGGDIKYGNDDTSTPRSIISSGSYTSPFAGIQCNKEITIIYITDGDPTLDDKANSIVGTLTGRSTTGNYLGVLGSWMATKNWRTFTDIAATPKEDILASVKIHTVGFGGGVSETNLLKLAARDGELKVKSTRFHDLPAGGKYHEASTAAALKDSLGEILLEVMGSSTLTSASVSANSFDRTQTLDSVYYGMFEPSTAARWQGNLKKYKIVNGQQVDVLKNTAVNAAGEFKDTSKSYWSAVTDDADGNDVTKGGVAEMLRTTATSGRTLLTDITLDDKSLTEFSQSKITDKYPTATLLADAFGLDISEVGDTPNYIKWAMGVDVDADDYDENEDISTTDVRPDVFGDPLHSKPVVITYDKDKNPRIVVGTNAGVLHMFEDVSDSVVKESWAYLPKEFFKKIKPLRQSIVAIDNKIYGLDGQITLQINDENNDGKVNNSDTVWLFFGLRRGGSSYYALDITDPDDPKLMWHIENKGEFSELGLTFSKPQVVRSAFNTDDPDNLVVIFGGGYDTKKDQAGPNTHNDGLGAAVYMVNARTGALIFKQATGSKNSIASSVASLDSDNDGLVDRLYVGDTGGDVWRVDMPDENHSSIIKLASLGGITNPDDRRFFNQPDIVRTYILETFNTGSESSPNIIKQEIPYDAILLGSGDKATPTSTDTDDKFFMIKDKYIKTQQFGSAPATAVPAVITRSNLYDYTDDPFKGYPVLTSTQKGYLVDASKQSGWYFDLEQSGEKNSAKSIVINNTVYFTSYSPSPKATCTVNPGNAWLYAVNLALGIKKYNWSGDPENREDRIKYIGNQFLGAPTLISTPVTDAVTGVTITQGNLIVGKEVLPEGFRLQTMRTSLTIPEN